MLTPPSRPNLFYSSKKRVKFFYLVFKFRTYRNGILFNITLRKLNSVWKFKTQLWDFSGLTIHLVFPGWPLCMPVIPA